MNTKKISTGLVALLMIIMALAPSTMNVEELNDNIDIEYGHEESVASGTAEMAGILSWQDDAWNATWTCNGGLALATPSNWSDFVSSDESDPHNYTSWAINLTGAGSYAISDAPAGTWVVTAGLTCTDDAGVWRSAGGQFGDSHESPDLVNISIDSIFGNVSFMLIEHGDDMGGDELLFFCGDGDGIAFGKVNNGIQDCDDGADEQQYDTNGTEINWFDCSGGTEVWIHQVNDGTEDCPEGDDEMHDDGGGDCPFDDVSGSPCEPVATNPCFSDWSTPECEDYVMDYCAINSEDSGCDVVDDGPTFVCGNGTEIAFEKVNNGIQDCADGADEQQYNTDGTEINWFDCSGGTEVWIHQVNDGTEDCPEGDDEMHDDEGGEMDCDSTHIEFHLVTSAIGGVNFVFDMVCEFSVEQSNQYREMIDMYVGNGDGEVSATEVAAFMEMMDSCYDEDGTVIDCDESCYEEDGTVIECDEDADDEEWTINGVIMEMYDTGMEFDLESILGDGRIITVNEMSSQHVDLVEGQEEVTVRFVNNDDDVDDDDDDDECFTVQVLPSGDWSPTSVSVEPAENWTVLEMDGEEEEVFAGYDFYGCSTPDTFTAVFEYTGEGHPNGVENLPPVCEFMWFIANDTAFENGNLVTEGPDGDVEIELGLGSYMISVWCTDAEMDSIQVTWDAPELNLSNTYDGEGEVNGWVMFIVPPGLSENIVVPYSWTSEEWNGSGDFIIIVDSGVGDGGDIEGSGSGLPGFTSVMTITALLGAVLFLGRRD
ncbi:MAG: PGF-CTERM sorting domain-containing protein [Candidatus Poseidoniales archaeon]|nr:PGF-CTERM sorting domain-containing protein [Candidatus Poseidoniales archaeon]